LRARLVEPKERVFNDSFDGIVLYVHEMPSSSRVMRGILISDDRTEANPQTIVAEEGVLISNPEGMKVTLRLRKGAIHRPEPQQDKYQIIRFDTYDLSLEARNLLGEDHKLERAGKNLSLYEIREKLERYGPGDRRYNALLVEYYKKFSIPFACLLLGFVGAPLGVKNRRSGKSGSFALSLLVIMSYYVLMTLGEGLGEKAIVPPALAIWFPNVVLGALALYVVTKVARESPFRLLNWMGAHIEARWEALRDRLRGLRFQEGEAR
jgi:lipopolysaccharide export system permease protein